MTTPPALNGKLSCGSPSPINDEIGEDYDDGWGGGVMNRRGGQDVIRKSCHEGEISAFIGNGNE